MKQRQKKIVDKFGDETIHVLQFEPLKLSGIKGISTGKALRIGQAFMEQEQVRQVVMFLQSYGISANYAVKVWKKFGEQSIEEIKRNPYRLTDDDINIGFRIADRVAISIGIDSCSKFRIQSGVQYALSAAVQKGHVYLPANILIPYTARLLGVNDETAAEVLDGMIFEESIYIERSNPDRVYLSAFYKAEQYVCRKIYHVCSAEPKKKIYNLDEALKEVENEQHVTYADKQLEAIRCSASESILVVTGGPGTGKTTLIKGIISLFKKQGMKVVLAAPTGRAAKRMTEASGTEAKTIHRLLEVGYIDGDDSSRNFRKNEQDPIEADVVIIDEASMVDVLLMHALLKAIVPGTRLVFVGDVDQLPSVGPGRVLSDMIDSGVLNVVRLDQIFRQAEESSIVTNAHMINKGKYPVINTSGEDFFFINKSLPQDTAEAILELCTSRIPEKFGLDPIRDIQVLSPMKKGLAGIFNLNAALQGKLNPPRPGLAEKRYRDIVFRENDRVMHIKNNYSLSWRNGGEKESVIAGEGVFNGDMGIIQKIDVDNSFLTVSYDDGKVVEYDFDMLDQLELAYAITVHKSQGSEFPAVVIALSGVPPMLACRNLLYTAITRARQLVILVGDINILKSMVDNNFERERFTGLKEKLCNIFTNQSLPEF